MTPFSTADEKAGAVSALPVRKSAPGARKNDRKYF